MKFLIFVIALIFLSVFLFAFKPAIAPGSSDGIIAPYYKREAFRNQLPPVSQIATSTSALEQKQIKLPILMYHYVEKNMPKDSLIRKKLTINPAIFERQLVTLKQAGYKFYFVREIPDLISGKIGLAKNSVVLTFDDGYKDFYTVVLPLLKKYQAKATVFVINNTIGGRAYLDTEQIKELIDSGFVEIGSHTLDHVALKDKSALEQRRQIEESKINLEKRFNIKINTFAYPYGSFSLDTAEIVRGAGFSCAVSVITGKEQSENNLYYLSRLRPGGQTGKNLLDLITH